MFNVVCEPEGCPAGVLIRAVEPLDEVPIGPTDGPGKLCKALDIDFSLHQLDLGDQSGPVFLALGTPVPEAQVRRGPRIGMGKTPEPWYSIERRWWIAGNPFVSKDQSRKD
jgi:DNA-3-methyladenine glycosylase